jgi:hypothetical protein
MKILPKIAELEVLAALTLRTMGFCVVTSCGLEIAQHFRGTYHLPFDVNTSLSSVPDTLRVQKLERHEIGTNIFRKNFHDVIV